MRVSTRAVTVRSCGLCVGLALAIHLACAQTYPAKPVRVVIPWPTGGANDIAGRIVAQPLSEITGQPFVVENRGGGSGVMGAEVVAKSPPDGYTIMIHSATHVVNAHLRRKLPYDTLKDFGAIAGVSGQIAMLVVHPSMPVKTTKELIALARSKPAQIVYGSSGVGAFPHLAMALFNATANTNMIHVAYKGGGPAAVAIGSGEVQAMIASIASIASQLQFRRVRPLAVTSERRVAAFPNVPTIAESGLPGYELTSWVGALAPAATPKPIIDRLNVEIQRILRMPEVSEKLKAHGLDPMPMTAEQFSDRLRSDYEKYGKIIKLTGTTVD
jgi:tripartite-type tricarboxylate transporter receptor subunit TctC